MIAFSVCMIVKNEEKKIIDCLEAIRKAWPCESDIGPVLNEIVILDTGSSDSTLEVVSSQIQIDSRIKLYSYDWADDFSQARNTAISHTLNDWLLVLDADETVTCSDNSLIESLMRGPIQRFGYIERRNHFEADGQDMIYTDRVERFFNKKAFHYEGSIHEQLMPVKYFPVPSEGISFVTGICVEHTGYLGSADDLSAKSKRNEQLLLNELKSDPDNPYIYFQLGQCYNGFDDSKALEYYSKGLSYDVDPSLEYVQMMVIAYGYALLHLEKFEEALGLEGIYDEFATSADFLTLMGVIYMRTGNYLKAMSEFLKATLCPISHHEGANSFIPLFNMGLINEMAGEISSAIGYYQRCGDFRQAKERLEHLQEKK